MSNFPKEYTVNLEETGELMIPEPVRQQLNLQPGDQLTLTIEKDGSLRLVSLRQQIQKLRGIFKDIAPGVSLADELIRERREEARREGEW
ncbi:MAG: AbrB/MazE/SpoVT family DNA-binding domain-containing protein [Limnospira sp.]